MAPKIKIELVSKGVIETLAFFHAKALARYQKNYIEGLVDDQGRWQEDESKLGNVVVAYFDKLFTSSKPDDFTEILHAIQPKVTTAMNEDLTQAYMAQEIRVALKQMYPMKASGLDCMPPIFFPTFLEYLW